jgi:hypothetical protein
MSKQRGCGGECAEVFENKGVGKWMFALSCGRVVVPEDSSKMFRQYMYYYIIFININQSVFVFELAREAAAR